MTTMASLYCSTASSTGCTWAAAAAAAAAGSRLSSDGSAGSSSFAFPLLGGPAAITAGAATALLRRNVSQDAHRWSQTSPDYTSTHSMHSKCILVTCIMEYAVLGVLSKCASACRHLSTLCSLQ